MPAAPSPYASFDGKHLQSLRYGLLELPTGSVHATDPFTWEASAPPLVVALPKGPHEVSVQLFETQIAYAELRFSEREPMAWEHVGDIAVDAGAACFASSEALERLASEEKRSGDSYRPELIRGLWLATQGPTGDHPYARRVPLTPYFIRFEEGGLSIPVFPSPLGDGVYPCYLARDSQGAPCRLVIDFCLNGLSDEDPEDEEASEPRRRLLELDSEQEYALRLGIDSMPVADGVPWGASPERHSEGRERQTLGEYAIALDQYRLAFAALEYPAKSPPELLRDLALCVLHCHGLHPSRGQPATRAFLRETEVAVADDERAARLLLTAAAKRFKQRAEQPKGRAETLFQLARCHALLENRTEMLTALEQSIAANPKNAVRAKKESDFAGFESDRDFVYLLAAQRRNKDLRRR